MAAYAKVLRVMNEQDARKPAEAELNPYAAPAEGPVLSKPVLVPIDQSAAEAIRRRYLSHEASVKAIGSLSIFGAVVLGCMMFYALAQALGLVAPSDEELREMEYGHLVYAGVAAVFLVLAVISALVGIGLRRLRPWARWVETAFCALGLIVGLVTFNVLGVLFDICILYLMQSSKGEMVFSPAYKNIIAQTPQIKYRIHKAVKILLMILVIFLGMIFTIAVLPILVR